MFSLFRTIECVSGYFQNVPVARSVLDEYKTQKQALSSFFIGAMLQTTPVLEIIRRELRRISPDVRIDLDQLKDVLLNEVIKREVIERKVKKRMKQRKKYASCSKGTSFSSY
jgi:hypothetical protein